MLYSTPYYINNANQQSDLITAIIIILIRTTTPQPVSMQQRLFQTFNFAKGLDYQSVHQCAVRADKISGSKAMINTSDSKFTGFNSSLATKVVASMRATSKCDKYARLASNILKFLRLSSSVYKDRFSRAYSELLILRQVLRWQGLYSILTDLHKEFPDNLKWKNLSSLLFTFLEAFSDMLDRMAFIIPIVLAGTTKAEGAVSSCSSSLLKRWLPKVQQLESDCYFVQCFIWLLHHLRTFRGAWKSGDARQRLAKVLKMVKYVCDSLTSYCKFSHRAKEIQPKVAATLGIISSLIGIYDLLK